MANQSFRAAFWALLLAFALSICALCSDPEQVRLALMTPPAGPVPGHSDAPETLLANREAQQETAASATTTDRAPPTVVLAGAPEPWDGDLIHEQSDHAGAESSPGSSVPQFLTSDDAPDSTVPEFLDPLHVASPPVREATSSSGVDFPWLVHSSGTQSGEDTRYEELPSPPEFGEPVAPDKEDLSVAAVSQLATLNSQIEDLREQVEQLQTSQLSVEASLQNLTAPPHAKTADEVVLLSWVLEVEGSAARDAGLIEAMLQSAEFPAVQGASSEDQLRFAWIEQDGTSFWNWLNREWQVREIAGDAWHVAQHDRITISLPATASPRIQQARGTDVIEQTAAPLWGGALFVRTASDEAGVIDVEFQPESGARAPDWMHARVNPNGVIVIAGPVVTGRNDGPTDSRAAETRAPARQQIVILQPYQETPTESLPESPERELLLAP